MTAQVSTQPTNLGDLVKWEHDTAFFSREQITLKAAIGSPSVLALGTVLGCQLQKGATTAAKNGGNTGNGAIGAVSLGTAARYGSYTIACTTAPDAGYTATATPHAGNTGSGLIGTVTATSGAVEGVYKLYITEAITHSGEFTLTDPTGAFVAQGTVGVAFSHGGVAFTLAQSVTDPVVDWVPGDEINIAVTVPGSGGVWSVTTPAATTLATAAVGAPYTSAEINFTITKSSTPFIIGDAFKITVADSGSGKYVQLAPTATDGTQNAAGVLFDYYTVPVGSDLPAVAFVRQAVLSDYGLTWPTGITAPQQALATAQLREKGIVIRASA